MHMHNNIPLIAQVSDTLRDMLGGDFDAETFWDTLDGETDALDLIDHILAKRAEDAALAAAAKAQADALSKRAKRIAERDNAHKRAIMALLNATGEKKVERPGGTVSILKGRVSVQITDETAVPSQLCKTTVTPDKTAIKKQLEVGEDVPGAVLSRGEETISVRVA